MWNITWSAILPLPLPQWLWTSTWLFSSPWTTSSSDKTICVADHPNSEFWQRIGQPYAHKSGRCFVAVVDIETDRCAVCLAELDAVQSEADRQAGVCARRLSGREGGQATNNLPTMQHCKQNCCVWKKSKKEQTHKKCLLTADIRSFLFVLTDLWLTWVFHVYCQERQMVSFLCYGL